MFRKAASAALSSVFGRPGTVAARDLRWGCRLLQEAEQFVAEHSPFQLESRGARQGRAADMNTVGTLMAGQSRGYPRHGLTDGVGRLGAVSPRALLGDGHQVDLLPPPGGCHAQHAHLADAGDGRETPLQLVRANVLAGRGDDDILDPPAKVEVALAVQSPEVSGPEPAVDEGGGRGLGVVVVAGEHARPPGAHLAHSGGVRTVNE